MTYNEHSLLNEEQLRQTVSESSRSSPANVARTFWVEAVFVACAIAIPAAVLLSGELAVVLLSLQVAFVSVVVTRLAYRSAQIATRVDLVSAPERVSRT